MNKNNTNNMNLNQSKNNTNNTNITNNSCKFFKNTTTNSLNNN